MWTYIHPRKSIDLRFHSSSIWVICLYVRLAAPLEMKNCLRADTCWRLGFLRHRAAREGGGVTEDICVSLYVCVCVCIKMGCPSAGDIIRSGHPLPADKAQMAKKSPEGPWSAGRRGWFGSGRYGQQRWESSIGPNSAGTELSLAMVFTNVFC